MASWTGTTPYATKKQLVSSISGLYDDLQDFQFSTISQVSTLTASDWISTGVLYVSDLKGYNIDISGITFDASGLLYAPLISSSQGNFNIINVSSMKFEFNPTFSGDIKVSFDLGLGQAIGGLLGGLGAAVGGAFIGVGTGLGLAIQGAEQGIATMIAGRPQNFINNNVYETINFTSQLQISTLGYDYPLYSTIIRTVSSSAADSVPGQEIFLSTTFAPGTTCIRSVSDPFNLISGNSNLNTSTIQSFGQWVPLPVSDDTPVFSTLEIVSSNVPTTPLYLSNYGTDFSVFQIDVTSVKPLVTQSYPNLPNPLDIAFASSNNSYLQFTQFPLDLSFISSSYTRFQSTLTITAPDPYFIRSTISTPCEFTWNGTIGFPGGDFAIVEPDETSFRSTATMDFIANTTDLFIQWGLGVNNHNSTIAAGTAKRVSWDIDANTSNFIDIPPVPSTLVGLRENVFAFQAKPNEVVFQAIDSTPFTSNYNLPMPLAFNVNSATFGAETTFSNTSNYPYQFNGNTFINGTLEANTIIALSSIIAVSTFAQTLFSTNIIEAASGLFTSTLAEKSYSEIGFISTLKASDNWTNDYISVKSRVRAMGYQTPLSIVTGTNTDIYNTNSRFDFVTDTIPQAVYLETQPANLTLMSIYSTNIEIPNLTVDNLTANNIVYTNADVPNLQTSTITFGWTGNFASPTPPDFSLQQSLTTEPGLFYNNYIVASNQILNIMNFSNTVNMLAQQFSTPLTYLNTTFDGTNRQGWASTIFYNAQTTPARVNLGANAGNGELSLQAQTFNVVVSLNTNPGNLGGVPVAVPVGSTYKFTSDGSSWTTLSNAPTPGIISYTNNFKMSMDYETLNISTSDTLVIDAEQINLNGIVNIPNAQLSNLYTDGFVSTTTFVGKTYTATQFPTSVTNSFFQPFQMFNTVNTASDGLINNRGTVTPSRGFNLFNSYNYNEWNNTQYNIDTNVAAGRPTIILGEVIVTSTPVSPYSGQFWINNTIDSPALTIPIYVNNEGVLSNIGNISGNTYARIFTTNGVNWSINSNVPQPQGTINATYSNYYTVAMDSEFTTINAGMPLVYNTPSLLYNTNKVFFYAPQIRVATIDAPSFNTREAGMEAPFYYDSNISFTKEGGTSFWYSDAFNPILGIYENTYYSVAGWQPTVSLTRLRISGNAISGFELNAVGYPVGGGASDYVWGTARYVRIITDEINPSGNLRESYTMIPRNYFNFAWQGQGPINQ